MGNLIEYIGNWALQNPAWTDLIIGAGILIQGELTILFSVYLVVSDKLEWMQFLGTTLGTLIIGESFVYFFGRMIRNTRFGWKLHKKNKTNKRIQSYTYYLKTNMGKLLIISKFLPATNFVILSLIGWSKTKFGKFLKSYIISVGIWFGSMTIIAYFFMSGLHYLRSAKIFREVEIGIVVILVIILFGEHILRKIIKKYSAIEENAEEFGNMVEEKIEESKKENPVQ